MLQPMTKLSGQQLGSKPHLPSIDWLSVTCPRSNYTPRFSLFAHIVSKRRHVETIRNIKSNGIKGFRSQFTTGKPWLSSRLQKELSSLVPIFLESHDPIA
jgi:hypothetical protein